MRNFVRLTIVGVYIALAPVFSPTLGLAADATAETLTFEKHIRPIFRAHCYDCHGATNEIKGQLDLRLVRFMVKGGESGPALTPGDPAASYFFERVESGDMPPGEAKVSPEEIETLRRWIAAGAATARPEPESIGPGLGITPEDRAFWAFQPVKRPEIKEFPADARVRTPIDALLLEAMPSGLAFSPDADRLTLIKRAYFDLIGLPPSPAEIERALNDQSSGWYDHLIEELLKSPHYGERWGRHWLDVAGYADSEGYTLQDAVRPWAWKYRDYVIQSLNADKPFNEFLVEQLAGDELAGPRTGDLTARQIELLSATGYLRMCADGTGSGSNTPESRNQVMADTLKIVSSSLLAMSVACAQCHDHRYDPIPHTDYYSLRAIFEPALDWQKWQTPQQRQVSLYTQEDRKLAAEIEAEVAKIAAEKGTKQAEFMKQALDKELAKYEEPLREQLRTAYETAADKRSEEQKALLKQYPSVNISPGVLYQYLPEAAEELKKFDQKIAAERAKKPVEEFVRAISEAPGHTPETRLFHRGDHQQPKDVVAPAGLGVVSPEGEQYLIPPKNADLPTTGRRLAYARWLTNGTHPLVSRVLVNRVWLHHFGRAIVGTPGDFGRLGMPPTHPQLLDWLADEFVQQGWSLKQLHRLIMLSTAYRQASTPNPAMIAIDPSNVYYWRKPIVRLEAELLQDRVLATSGELDRTLFGQPVAIQEDETGQVVVANDPKRRSMYVQVRRSRPVAMLQAFDAPVMVTNCEVRSSSTVATQSLMLMNGEFMLNQAAKMAARTAREAPQMSSEQLAELPVLPSPPQSAWQFGYGSFDESQQRTGSFALLPHWSGSVWQGGPKAPDEKLGWVILHANGGHPGGGANLAVIRRWVAPADGTLAITGKLQHGSENGDGVRGRIVSNRHGLAGEWPVHHSEAATNVANLAVTAGDTLDLILDSVGAETSDSFTWQVEVTLTGTDGSIAKWDSAKGFHGPLGSQEYLISQAAYAWQLALCRPATTEELALAVEFLGQQLTYLGEHADQLPKDVTAGSQVLTNLCQVLLSSNEFLYVD